MTSGVIGSPSGNVLVPVANLQRRTKVLTTTDLTCTGSDAGGADAGFSLVDASIIFYRDSASKWRMKGNLGCTVSSGSRTYYRLSITGVTFKDVNTAIRQPCAGNSLQVVVNDCFAQDNAAYVQFEHASATTTAYSCTVDVELKEEPTTYTTAANMEGAPNVAAYIPSASASTAGLVDTTTQTFAGVKTFSNGIAFANETLSTYDEGTYTCTMSTSNGDQNYSGSNVFRGWYVKVGKLVTCGGNVYVPTVTSAGTGYLKILLPFTVANSSYNYSVASLGAVVNFAANSAPCSGICSFNTTNLALYKFGASDPRSGMVISTAADAANGCEFYWSFQYMATT